MINLNNYKADETDGIHKIQRNRIYELVRQIWEEERTPEEWKETITVPT